MVLWISHGTLGSGTILWISHILGSGMVLWISHVTFGDQVWYSGIRHGTLDQLSYFGIRHYTLDQSWYFGIRHGTLDQALYFGIRHGTLYQSCRAANHYVLAVVCTTLLRSWSYHYAFPEKNKNCLFLIPCVRVGIRFTSNRLSVCLFVFEMLVVPQPIGVCILTSWPIVAFGSIPAFMRHFLARRLPFSIISNAMPKWEAESELPGDESGQKNAHQNFREEYYTEQFLCVVRSTQSAKHVTCSACFFSSWDFSVAHGEGGPYI